MHTNSPNRQHRFLVAIFFVLALFAAKAANAQDYLLSLGDTIRVQVFQNPDLTVETRIAENGIVTYPLVGTIALGGLSVPAAEKKLAGALRTGGFLKQPQVNITLLQVRGSQFSVLGQVNRPGRFALDTASLRVSDALALAGGATSTGDDTVILSGTRDGAPFRKTIDIPALFLGANSTEDIMVAPGDSLYVHRAPVFYIYGEAQRNGPYRIERGMNVMQGLAAGGGTTSRGTESRLQLYRKDAKGAVQKFTPELTEPLQPNDVIYVRESLF
jgi:polysaccharide export outer membrane protein